MEGIGRESELVWASGERKAEVGGGVILVSFAFQSNAWLVPIKSLAFWGEREGQGNGNGL